MSKNLNLDQIEKAVKRLSKEEQEAWRDVAVSVTGDNAFIPNVGPQTEAFHSEADELLYGGAAGGGKTALLAGAAICSHTHARIYRRTFPQLAGIVEELKRIIGHDKGFTSHPQPVWRNEDPRYKFKKIELGGLNDASSMAAWYGRPADLIGFDELSEFDFRTYKTMIQWLRTTIPNQRTRVIATTNPPDPELGASGMWMLDYWGAWLNPEHPNPAEPGELRYYIPDGDREVEVEDNTPREVDGRMITPRSRTFIRALVTDNPDLMATGYLNTLASAPEDVRRRLLEGRFTLTIEDHASQIIPSEWVRKAQARWNPKERPPRQTALGVDVALGGKDNLVIAPRYDGTPLFQDSNKGFIFIDELVIIPGKELRDERGSVAPEKLGPLVMGHMRDGAEIRFDAQGVGQTLNNYVRSNEISHKAITSSARANKLTRCGTYKFASVRTAMYWNLREMLDPQNNSDIALPPSHGLLLDLTCVRYKVSAGVISAEGKEDIKKRIGRSTDEGDAVLFSLWGDTLSARRKLPSDVKTTTGHNNRQILSELRGSKGSGKNNNYF